MKKILFKNSFCEAWLTAFIVLSVFWGWKNTKNLGIFLLRDNMTIDLHIHRRPQSSNNFENLCRWKSNFFKNTIFNSFTWVRIESFLLMYSFSNWRIFYSRPGLGILTVRKMNKLLLVLKNLTFKLKFLDDLWPHFLLHRLNRKLQSCWRVLERETKQSNLRTRFLLAWQCPKSFRILVISIMKLVFLCFKKLDFFHKYLNWQFFGRKNVWVEEDVNDFVLCLRCSFAGSKYPKRAYLSSDFFSDIRTNISLYLGSLSIWRFFQSLLDVEMINYIPCIGRLLFTDCQRCK